MSVYYTKEHEWLAIDGTLAKVGITKHAADALGDLVFVEVQPADTRVLAQTAVATVESVKAASDIYAPLSGIIIEINPEVSEDPGLVTADPEGAGWLFKLKLDDPGEVGDLLDRDGYDSFLAQL